MLKQCVILNGQIINIGEWDYQMQPFELEPPQYNEEGELIKEGVYEDRPTNPFPEGTTTEERNVEYDADRGWYEVGMVALPTIEERMRITEDWILDKMLGGV
jgi:hypothetical protein